MMKRTGSTAGDDFGDNRVPGKGQNKRFRKSLTTVPELDNQRAVIKTHRDGFPWFSARRARRRDVCASQGGRNDVRCASGSRRLRSRPLTPGVRQKALPMRLASLAASFLPGNKRTRSLWVFIIAPWYNTHLRRIRLTRKNPTALDHSVHRVMPMGAWVLINAGWYEPLGGRHNQRP